MKRNNKKVVPHIPTSAQKHAYEYFNTIKDLSTVQLFGKHRLTTAELEMANLDIIEQMSLLKITREKVAKLSRERDVLNNILEERR